MNQFQQTQHNMQMGSGLTRYRSAPSSYFASFLNNTDGGFGADEFGQLFNPRASSPETQRIFARFMNIPETIPQNCSQSMNMQSQSQFLPPRKKEPETEQPQQELQRHRSNDYSSSVMYQSSGAVNSAMGSSYGRILGSKRGLEMKMDGGSSGGGGGGSGLVRHSSSPAGLFGNINIESEFGAKRGMGNSGAGNIANSEATFSSATRFTSQTDFSSRNSSSSSGIMPPISEIQNKTIGEDNPGDKEMAEDHDYLINPWDDPAILSDDFLIGLSDTDKKLFPKAEAPDYQVFSYYRDSYVSTLKGTVKFSDPRGIENDYGGNRTANRLSHHLSLPKSPAMEKLLQDAVPCKIRAKRGCATHPRSIAERVRRTKISERMRKLQDLVPNMEKQTNTADMLDLAVDFIKDLQRQVKVLSDNHAKCSCSAKK